MLLGDPQGHTAALAENTSGAQCSGSRCAIRSSEAQKVIARVPFCSSVICDVMEVELDKVGVVAVVTLCADFSVEAGAVAEACRRVFVGRARSRFTTASDMDKFGVMDACVVNVDEISSILIKICSGRFLFLRFVNKQHVGSTQFYI